MMRSAFGVLVACCVLMACGVEPAPSASAPPADRAEPTRAEPVGESTQCDSAEPVGESTQCDSNAPFGGPLPSGPCEDRCYEIYLNDIAECQRLYPGPRNKMARQRCYALASYKHGECRKNCRPHEPEQMDQPPQEPQEREPDPFGVGDGQ
jgi:hypothetical protein